MVIRLHRGIVGQHLTHLLLREAGHLIELRLERVVRADVETAGQVVHRHRADTRDEQTLDGLVRAILDHVVELADIALAMRLLPVFAECVGMRQDLVREMVVLVNEKIELQAHLLAFVAS